jgi:putative ABC transport system permease protein
VLDYRLSTDVALGSIAVSLAVAALGAQSAVRRAVDVPPAEAMRPEPPARYRRSLFEHPWRYLRLTLTTRMVLRNLERQPVRALVSVSGIAFAVAVLFVGLAFIDVINRLIDQQFIQATRWDATMAFVEPRSSRAAHDVQRLPGVMQVEPIRSVPVRIRSGHRSRTLGITGLPADPALNRVVDRDGRPMTLPPEGLVLSRMLGDILQVAPGGLLQVEVLEGSRPVLDVPVAAFIDDTLGLQAYMRADAVHRMMREGPVLSGAAVTLDEGALDRFYAEVKLMPAVAGVALRQITLQNFRRTMAETMSVQIFFNVLFAGVIAFGVVYNSARVSLSERSRELASLRVLGFTRGEISLILLGELALLTILARPLGALIGYLLGEFIITAFSNELYRMSFVVAPSTLAWSFLTVIVAAFLSGLLVRRRLDRLDLVAVLKTRE